MEASILDIIDGPPSSPFVTEVGETNSRSPSKQWQQQPTTTTIGIDEEDETRMATPQKPVTSSMDVVEDKENVPQDEPTATLGKMFASPEKQATPERIPLKRTTPEPATSAKPTLERQLSCDSDLMPPPPPSSRKATPKKTPLRSSRSGANTPRPLSRGDSYERTPKTDVSASAFQAGLDMRDAQAPPQDMTNVDDTCFSTFSEIPEMTIFAKLGQSPTKRGDMLRTPGGKTDATPRTTRKRLSTSRSPSPTSRRQKTPAVQNADGTTSFLIDFTQQMEGVNTYRPASPGKASTESNLLHYINNQRSPQKGRHSYATPSKQNNNILNLLDFELPPAPTPRSVPTITVRELESLKSTYLSQISSLKATLSGREAEVESLKRAVGDAERRVGEAQESLRDEKGRREHVEQEKAEWEKRGREVECVLSSVKEEVMKSEVEKEELLRKVEDSERRAEDAETRAVKAEERFADALAARAGNTGEGDSGNSTEDHVQRLVSAQIDAKIEAVSRELHAVYKDKHERKVGTLKKSYEARSEKKCAELVRKVEGLEKTNEELLAARDSTFSGPVVSDANDGAVALKTELEEQKAALARMEEECLTSRHQQNQLMRELQQERIEKGDLVAAVDEMLALQSEGGTGAGPRQGQAAMSVVEDFRKSIGRPSGLRAPGQLGAAQSRIGGGPGMLGRSTSGGKSRLLSNIERMGRTGSGNLAE
ncbi:hypothetical protein LTR78_000738 [Recurvomyces mirabilis]|uniref:Uncharacterized protein n=1 Tax=Recurvomyces mirabilis TaxID=574656 RepID=A0AAE1C5S8_9PEZI|nr:hypothetical protein LTR78_000738 [Recurvomyces mirabilis]KAK5158708.1 hypothetical protein LTS14_002816 [Recurvomyces mirabilis]